MNKIILIFIFFLFISVANASGGDMHELATAYMKQFEKGMTLEDVRRNINTQWMRVAKDIF